MRPSAAVLLLALTAPAAADVVVLTNGDRVTGRIEGRATRRLRLNTPYGLLLIPREKVERVVHDDGKVELVNAPVAPPPAPAPPPPPPIPLALSIRGATFWQAWDPKAAPADPTLRLEVRLDHVTIATYTDANLDPDDLPKAVVNSFVFSPERLFVSGAEGITVGPPALAGGEIRLELRLPERFAGDRRLRLAYQLNDASSGAPRWRDVVVAGGQVSLAPGALARLRVAQDRGTMDYSKRLLRGLGQMRGVETFRATLEPEPSP